jgi:hypothetical protein
METESLYPTRPFYYEAFQSLSNLKLNYPEKYCHKTGKFSNDWIQFYNHARHPQFVSRIAIISKTL